MKRHIFIWLPIIIAFSLLTAFCFTTPVLAEDEPPQPEAAPAGVVPVPEGAPAEAPAEVPAEVAAISASALDEQPPEQGLTILPDPWFMVGTIKHSYTNIQDAVDAVAGGLIPSDGFIYVDAGDLPDQVVLIDGSDPDVAKLKGIVGHVNADTLQPDAILSFDASGSIIKVRNKMNGFILKGFNISGDSTNPVPMANSGVVDLMDNGGSVLLQDLVTHDASTNPAIRIVSHNGPVTFKNIDSSDNHGSGAVINNTLGTAGVTISGSSFDDNVNIGLDINTNGTLLINGVTASRNDGTYSGLVVDHASSVTISNGVFNNNTNSEGLTITDLTGNITLTNVFAEGNLGGMTLTTRGNITLSGVSASRNAGYGAHLDTCNGNPCTWLGTGKVTISSSIFDLNAQFVNTSAVLEVRARGAIAMTNVSMDENGLADHLVYVAKLYTDSSLLVSPVTVTNSTFNGNMNQNDSLFITANGAITLTSVQACDSSIGAGASLQSKLASVTLKGSATAWNSFNYNLAGTGLNIVAKGPIAISYAEALGNDYGINLVNDWIPGKPVTINHAVAISNDYDGLDINSAGAVSLTAVTASSNSTFGNGIKIYNAGGSAGVTLKDSSANNNSLRGIDIMTRGAINLSNMTANENGLSGIYLNNPGNTQAVIIKGATTNANDDYGIAIFANGAVSLTNITADGNYYYGIMLGQPDPSLFPKSVTISHAEINENCDPASTGCNNLQVYSGSTVTLSYVEASDCQAPWCRGAIIGGNGDLAIPGKVSISHGKFNGNKHDGLYIYAKSSLVLSTIEANGNTSNGAWLNNMAGDPLFPTITITNGNFNNNQYGLNLISRGGITLINTHANQNTEGGAWLSNISGNISVLTSGAGGNAFIGNGNDYGLWVDTAGNVVLNNVVACSNGSYGVIVTYGKSPFHNGNVTINGGTFNDNGIGLHVISSIGTILVNGIHADDNSDRGGRFYNDADHTGTKSITINKSTFNGNGSYGVEAYSWGQITLNNVSVVASSITSEDGALLDNSGSTLASPKGVSILGSLGANVFSNSGTGSGLVIASKGAVSITRTTASDNHDYGIIIDNFQGGSGKGTTTLSYLTTNRNGQAGMLVNTNNAVTLSNVTTMFTHSPSVGIYIMTNNHNLTISNSLITANENMGLAALMGGTTGIFKMTNTFYLGNCTVSGTLNVQVTH